MGSHFRKQDDFIQILEVTPATREALERCIERLIALLDTLDPDPDREPDEDSEPWLAGGDYHGGQDLELDTSDYEPDVDDEEDYRHAPAELPDRSYEREAA